MVLKYELALVEQWVPFSLNIPAISEKHFESVYPLSPKLGVLGSNSFGKRMEMDSDGKDGGFWFCKDGNDERSSKNKSLSLSSMNDVSTWR